MSDEYEGLEDEDTFVDPGVLLVETCDKMEVIVREYITAGGAIPFMSDCEDFTISVTHCLEQE